MSPDDPSHHAQLAAALAPYLSTGRAGVLLAVSGGPDSTALMHAAATPRGQRTVAVATVDHGLRPQSRAEAESVGRLAARLGLDHRILAWDAPRRAGLQAAAREARYRLLAAHAAVIGAGLVLTAHTRDDQAETILMRLIAGSGPAGLAGMRRERALGEGVRLARPFLGLAKAELTAYCEAHDLPFVTDPSNADPLFARARLRALMPALAAEGLSTERLCRLAERLARDEAALAQAAGEALRAIRCDAADGTLVLDGARLLAVPEAIALRVLDHAIETLQAKSAEAAPRRLERLERLVLDALLPALARRAGLRRTLRGVVVEARREGAVVLTLAPPRRKTGGSLVAGAPDLLGKQGGGAYISQECPD